MYVLSKVIHRCDSISKGLLHYVLWLVKEFALPSQLIRFKTKANRVLVTLVFLRFRQFACLWVLIGSLRYFSANQIQNESQLRFVHSSFPASLVVCLFSPLFSLAPRDIYLTSDWSLWLLRFTDLNKKIQESETEQSRQKRHCRPSANSGNFLPYVQYFAELDCTRVVALCQEYSSETNIYLFSVSQSCQMWRAKTLVKDCNIFLFFFNRKILCTLKQVWPKWLY